MMSISSVKFSIRLHLGTKALLLGLAAIFACSVFEPPLRAQNYLGQTGAPTFTTALPVELGFLNAANGNLHLTVPVGSFPQRGSVPFTAGLVYDSSIWVEAGTVPPSWQPTNLPNSWGGWRLVTSASPGSTWYAAARYLCDTPPPYQSYTIYGHFAWIAPDGTQHLFSGIQTESDSTICDLGDIPNGDAFATDSSGYHMYVTNFTTVSAVYAPDGTQVYPTVKDTNGNYFSFDSNGNVVDTLGRTPITGTTVGNITTYAVLNSEGSTSSITVTTTTISVSTAFHKPGVTEYSGTLTVIQKITLPDNTSYQFGYDMYGELNSIALPTGGQITYAYTNFTDAFSNVGRWGTTRTSAGGTWSYVPSVVATCGSEGPNCKQQVTVTKPSGDNTVYSFVLDNGGWNSQIQSYSGAVSSSNLLATSTATWNFSNPCQGVCTGNQNVQKLTQTLALPVPGGWNVTQTKQYTYDSVKDSNLTKIQEWNFYSGSLPGTPDRETDITYQINSSYTLMNIINRVLSVVTCAPTGTPPSCNGSTNIGAQTNFAYDQGTLTSVSNIVHHDDTNFGTGNTIRGNLTQTQRWVNGSTSVTTNTSYDTTGQVVQITDQINNSTTFDYTDAYYSDNGANPPQPFTPNQATHAYVTGITVPIIGKTSRGYYFNTGKLAFSQDPNGANIYQHYQDLRDRLTHTYGALVNGLRSWTLRNYSSPSQEDYYQTIGDAQPSTGCTSCRHDRNAIDGFGNSVRRTLVSDPSGPVFIDEGYDSTGRLQTVSNPYRATSDPTYGTETRTYDGMDRILTLTYADATVSKTFYGANVVGAGGLSAQLCLPASTYGLGYPMLAINAASKMRQTWRDGFGRIIEVDEPDSSNHLTRATCSTFNTLDALIQTTQGGQNRSFTYDELSRITSLSTPEGGTTTFYYLTVGGGLCAGDSSLVCRRTDAQGTTITYTYDALGRLTQKTYSDSTPTVHYSYDQSSYNGLNITNGIGRGTGMSDGSGATAWSYDPSGHVTSERRTIGSVTKLLQYGYTVSGLLSTITFPSGRTVTYSYNTAAQPVSAIDGSGTNYAKSSLYAPTGMISSVVYGQVNGGFSGINENFAFNNRLQSTRISASSSNGTAIDLSYQFSVPGGNDGNSASETNNRVPGRSVSWTYDTVDRISTAQSQDNSGPNCWGLSFAYDAMSNLQSESVTKCSAPVLSLTINGQNEITNSGFNYDLNGRLTSDGLYSYGWNAENQLVMVNGVTYTYDGNGRRVKKSTGRLYWRDLAGNSIAETDSSGNTIDEYVLFAGRPIAHLDATGNIYYIFADRLGSTRAVTQANGNICYDSDYYPFGGEINFTPTCQIAYRFTGYERDSESGLDYAFSRFYNSRIGRFMSPDPVLGDIADPESLNRFTYVKNNPTNLTDPDGKYPGDQHDFITFFLASLLGLPGAQTIADGARDADSFLNATTGLFLMGYFVNFSKHFGIPCSIGGTCNPVNSVGDAAYQLGFQLHLVEDISPNGPRALFGSYSLTSRILDSLDHIFLNLIGKSPDTSAERGGGFKAAYVVMGGKPGDYPQTVVEWLRDAVNTNGLQIIGMQFIPTSGQTVNRGFTDLSNAVEIGRTSFVFQGNEYTMVLYWIPNSDYSFYDDPNVQAIMAQGLLSGISDAEVGYQLYLYSNGLPPDVASQFPLPPYPKNTGY